MMLESSSHGGLWAVLIGGGWGLLDWAFGKFWKAHKEARAQTWPISSAQVTKAAVYKGNHDATLTLWYSYPVPDEPYPIPAEFQKGFDSVEKAQAWADALSDQTIPVRVHPKNSWKSVLLDSDLAVMVRAAAPDR